MTDTKFGDLKTIPFSEPAWYDSRHENLNYNDSHRAWRQVMRDFVETEIMPNRDAWDESGKLPDELFVKAGKIGLFSAVVGWPEEVSPVPRPEGYTAFHSVIALDELARCGSGGVVWGLIGGLGIGLGPLIYSGTDEQKLIAKQVLKGEKKICLAISEPQAGSDVAGLTTVGKEVGDHFVVNGSKKWITGGTFSDYMTVAIRTGGEGMTGINLYLVPSKSKGVTMRLMACQGMKGSGTAFIEFDDVIVPKSALIGDVTVLLRNFVSERMGMAFQANRYARVCLTETIMWVRRRKAFGKFLQDQPVVRHKIALMAKSVESTHAYLESLVSRLAGMERRGEDWFEGILRLGAEAGLAKVQASQTFELCAREAAMIGGGQSYVMGNRVEHLYSPGGSADVLLDSSMRLALQGKL